MRLLSYLLDGEARYGAAVDGGVVDLTRRIGRDYSDVKALIAANALADAQEAVAGQKPDHALDKLVLLPPVLAPEKLWCIGVNYAERNAEYKDNSDLPKYPSLFVRSMSSMTGSGQTLEKPHVSDQLDYEGELVIVIGQGGRHIKREQAWSHIFGMTLCNEGTIRDWLRHGKFNVTQGKNFDRTGSIGPWLVPFTDEAQLADIRLETRVNGEVRQQDRTSRMIFSFRKIINYVSTFTTLVPGDVIVTGTPTGAGARFDPPVWLKPGDIVEVEAEGIGTLINPIADEA